MLITAGPKGYPGGPGEKGSLAYAPFHGFQVVKHTQRGDTEELNCTFDEYEGDNRLWIGYSLLFMEGNGETMQQDLGK
jgi:hypothetical protein